MTRIFFPLRTSVEFFRDPASVAAVARAKEAAILYDELVFEAGLYDIGITAQGSFANWRPPGQFTPDEIARSRKLPEPGSGMRIDVGVQPGPDQPAPAEAMKMMFEGELLASYVSEWHTGVIDDLRQIKPSWCGTTIWGEGDPKLEPLKQQLRSAQEALALAYTEQPDESPVIRDFLIEMLARDAVVASSMDAAMTVTGLFAPLVESLGGQPDASGQTALGVLVPNVANLTWEQIAEFRDQAGAVDARGKLREFEERTRATEPSDPMEFRVQLFQEISNDFFAVIQGLSPKFGRDLGEEAAKFGVSFIPFVGPFLGPGASFVEAVYDAQERRHAWYAALMRLRNAATS